MKVVGILVCDDVSAGFTGNLHFHDVSFARFASAFPALLPRLVVVTVWQAEAGEPGGKGRVTVESPSGEVVADASFDLDLAPGQIHVQATRFLDVVLPEPGDYAVRIHLDGLRRAEVPLRVIPTATEEGGAR